MYQQHIVIIGAGIVGLSTAYMLLRNGIQHVTILEQAQVDHQRSPSRGSSRLLRFEYGEDRLYSEMVRMSLLQWHELERRSERILYTPTGLLTLGCEADQETSASFRILRSMGLPTEQLSLQQCHQRFPQFSHQNADLITYNANAGMLHASYILQTLKELILELGGEIIEAHSVVHLAYENAHRPICLRCASGEDIFADRVVIAAGSWVQRLLSELRLPIHMTRQYLLYFANLPASLFAPGAFPAFISDDLYGFPTHGYRVGSGPNWLKAASHTFGEPIDPDDPPSLNMPLIQQTKQRLCDLIPALRQAELAHVDTCMYDVSCDTDFILDYHPADSRIVFAAGLTGHGFKFGPLLGQILMSLTCQTPPPLTIERFRLRRFAPLWQTQSISVA